MKKNGIHFTSFFSPEDILCLSAITDGNQIIHAIVKRLQKNHSFNNLEQTVNAVLEREESQNTIVTNGIALPHARIDGLHKLLVGIATSPEGVTFVNGDRVFLVILILAPKDNPALYLEVLSSLSRICADKNVAQSVLQLKTPLDIWKFFEHGGVIVSDVVYAKDIMNPNPIFLKETDTLQNAIDLFIKHNLIELPVVDVEGELVGSVSAYELLKVCLPDYILWMEDLSPIINFEPFTNILRNEGTTWLAEIMSHEYALVSDDSPAIQVAKEITKNHSLQAYVVKNKKLVGIISLQQFLNKVLRE